MIELSKLKENPKNARTISDEHFAALRHSVAARPWMFPLRPIVARRSDGVVLGGNMRLRALLANGVKEVPDDWIRWADLDERQCEEMHVVDNENFGDWIADDLLALYGRDRLAEMDVDVEKLLESISEKVEDSDEYGTEFKLKDGDKCECCSVSFVLSQKQAEAVKAAIKAVGECSETFGNTNKNGNALYEVVRQWLATR